MAGVFAPAPPDVRRLAEIIGLPATLALVERYAGTRLYVPQDPAGTELEAVVGPDAARALASRYGRDRLIPPVARRWRVLTYRERGLSYRAIALRVGCTENNVHRILMDAGRTTPQLDLFGS